MVGAGLGSVIKISAQSLQSSSQGEQLLSHTRKDSAVGLECLQVDPLMRRCPERKVQLKRGRIPHRPHSFSLSAWLGTSRARGGACTMVVPGGAVTGWDCSTVAGSKSYRWAGWWDMEGTFFHPLPWSPQTGQGGAGRGDWILPSVQDPWLLLKDDSLCLSRDMLLPGIVWDTSSALNWRK